MCSSTNFIQLIQEISDCEGVEIFTLGAECCLVRFQAQCWKVWPTEGCWVEADRLGATIGEMHYGSIAIFKEKYIAANSFLPKQHSKRWTKSEKDQLQIMITKDCLIPDIAKKLGRSQRSILLKSAVLLGVNFDHLLMNEEALKKSVKSLIVAMKAGAL